MQNSTIYIVFNLACRKAIIFEVNLKKTEWKSWGQNIIRASRDEVALEGLYLPVGANWEAFQFTFPLQCIQCIVNKDVDTVDRYSVVDLVCPRVEDQISGPSAV